MVAPSTADISWSRFKGTIVEATNHVKPIDGEMGDQLRVVIDVVETIGIDFNDHWQSIWAKSTQKNIKHQQMKALKVLGSIYRSFKLMIDVYKEKQKKFALPNKAKEISEKHAAQAVTAMPIQPIPDNEAASAARIQTLLKEAAADIAQNSTDMQDPSRLRDIALSIKKESDFTIHAELSPEDDVNVEMMQIDNQNVFIPSVKAEVHDSMQPISDLYCPDSGTSRPLDSADPDPMNAPLEEGAQTGKRKLDESITNAHADSNEPPLEESPRFKLCYLCKKLSLVDRIFITPTDVVLKNQLISNLIDNKDKYKIMNLPVGSRVSICDSHVSGMLSSMSAQWKQMREKYYGIADKMASRAMEPPLKRTVRLAPPKTHEPMNKEEQERLGQQPKTMRVVEFRRGWGEVKEIPLDGRNIDSYNLTTNSILKMLDKEPKRMKRTPEEREELLAKKKSRGAKQKDRESSGGTSETSEDAPSEAQTPSPLQAEQQGLQQPDEAEHIDGNNNEVAKEPSKSVPSASHQFMRPQPAQIYKPALQSVQQGPQVAGQMGTNNIGSREPLKSVPIESQKQSYRNWMGTKNSEFRSVRQQSLVNEEIDENGIESREQSRSVSIESQKESYRNWMGPKNPELQSVQQQSLVPEEIDENDNGSGDKENSVPSESQKENPWMGLKDAEIRPLRRELSADEENDENIFEPQEPELYTGPYELQFFNPILESVQQSTGVVDGKNSNEMNNNSKEPSPTVLRNLTNTGIVQPIQPQYGDDEEIDVMSIDDANQPSNAALGASHTTQSQPGVAKPAGKNSSEVGKLLSSGPRTLKRCDLCRYPEPTFQLSPEDPALAQEFFVTLQNLTESAEHAILYFLERNRRVAVCDMHLPDYSVTEHQKLIERIKQASSKPTKAKAKRVKSDVNQQKKSILMSKN